MLKVTKEVYQNVKEAFAPVLEQAKELGNGVSNFPDVGFGYSCNVYDNGGGQSVVAVKVDGGIEYEGERYAGFKFGPGRRILHKYLSVW